MAANVAGVQFHPTALGLSYADEITGTTNSVTISTLSQLSSSIGMVFFDVTLDEGATGTFIVNATKGTGNPTIAGLTFDVIQEGAFFASAQTVTIFPNTAAPITLSGFSADGKNLSYAIADGPTLGTLDSSTIPEVTYTAPANYQGTDSFTFTVNDGVSNSAPATVTITMTNLVPTAASQSVSAYPDSPVAITLAGNDPDNGPSNLTYIVEQPIHGELIGASNIWTYTAINGYQGEDSFTFTVFDGLATSEVATVSITSTNLTPTADAQSVSTLVNSNVVITLTGSDPEGSNLTYYVSSFPEHGTLDTSLLPLITYSPDSEYAGTDSFSFYVSDGLANSAEATVLITIAAPGGVTISTVGDGDGYDIIGTEAASFYTTNVVKSFDVGSTIDNKYGTDGYYVFGGSNGATAEYNSSGQFAASVPTFVDSFSADTAVTLARNNSSQVPMDNPAAVSNGTDFVYGGYLMNNASAGTTDLPMLDFSVTTSEAVSFRLGVISGNESNADSRYDPTAIRLSFIDGTTTNITLLEALPGLSPTNGIGMIFFDVAVDAGVSGTFSLTATERSNNPTIGGVTFDVIPTDIKNFGAELVDGGSSIVFAWEGINLVNVLTNANLVYPKWGILQAGVSSPVTNAISSETQLFYKLSE
jgi:hypothetical protein